MSHRAAIYTVRAHTRNRKKEGDLPLGNVDGEGTSLALLIHRAIEKGFREVDRAEVTSIKTVSSELLETEEYFEVHAVFSHGQSKMSAAITDEALNLLLQQKPEHTHSVLVGSVFRIPKSHDLGVWALHQNNSRAGQSLIARGLRSVIRELAPDIVVTFKASVNNRAFVAAVDQGRVEQVTLVRQSRPNDRGSASADRWVQAGEIGKIGLTISGHGFLKSGHLSKLLDGREEVRPEIFEFADIEFEEANVKVDLGAGRMRTFNVDSPEKGYAMTVNLEGLRTVDGEPTTTSLFRQLGVTIDDLD